MEDDQDVSKDVSSFVFDSTSSNTEFPIGREFTQDLIDLCQEMYFFDQPRIYYAEAVSDIDVSSGYQKFRIHWATEGDSVTRDGITTREMIDMNSVIDIKPVYACMCGGFHGDDIDSRLYTWNYPKDVVPPMYKCPAFEKPTPHDTYHSHVYRPGAQRCDFDLVGPVPGDNVLLFHGDETWIVLDYVMNPKREREQMIYKRKNLNWPKDWVLNHFGRKQG
jgi:hypothetical protein